ncbi:MAG: SGNH/GDSL hydrolase family protein [Ruminococcaceae bacterium]|nr:SGNH/GDSL hydrolase family protein [Oscillospiraceae bacterium]
MKRIFAFALAVLTALSGLSAFALAEEKEEKPENPLLKKCVLFVGDSITEASNEWGTELVGWAGRIMKNNSMRGHNKGKSGATLSNVRGENTVIAQLKSQYNNRERYDYVIMHGGVNDAYEIVPVGIVTDGFGGPYDLTTFAGGLENLFDYARKTFTNAKFGYIISYTMPNALPHGKMSDMAEYFEIAKEICEKWGIPYIDFYFDEDFNKNVLKTHTAQYLPDTIHPNTAGYDIITPYIEEWMKTIEFTDIKREESIEESVEVSVEASTESLEAVHTHEQGVSTDTVVIIISALVAVAALAVCFVVLKN